MKTHIHDYCYQWASGTMDNVFDYGPEDFISFSRKCISSMEVASLSYQFPH